MSFTLVTTQVIIARNAGALYGLEVGNSNMTSYVSQVGSNVDAFLNTVYTNSVGNASTASVAAVLVANLGLTGDAATAGTNYIVAQLNAVAYTARGAVVNKILNDFANLSSDATFGAAATAWNDKVSNAVAYATVSGNADSTWGNVSAAPVGNTFTLTTGMDAFTGGAGADLFKAIDDTDGTGAITLNLGDEINGGAGSDSLVLTANHASGFSLLGKSISNIEKFVLDNVTDMTGDINLNKVGFSNIELNGLYNSSGTLSVDGIAANASSIVNMTIGEDATIDLNYVKDTSSTSVSTTDTVNFGAAPGTGIYQEVNIFRESVAATNVTSTLNINGQFTSQTTGDDSGVYQTITVGAAAATVTANVNYSGATEGGSYENYSGVYIDHDGTASVTANVSINDSKGIYTEIHADNSGLGTSVKNVANVTLSNAQKTSSGEPAVDLYDFGTINLTVNKASKIGDVYTYGADGAAYKSQTINITANADLTLTNYLDAADTGSVAVNISGAGNVSIAKYDGTGTALSTTVSDKIDASALSGALTVTTDTPINSVKGGSGNDSISLLDVSTFGVSASGGLVVDGGAGTDTIGLLEADYTTISTGASADRAKISGFEGLAFLDEATTATYDLSKIAGISGAVTFNKGVTSGDTATLTNLAKAAAITLAGDLVTNDGAVDAQYKSNSTADSLALTLKSSFVDSDDTTVDTTSVTTTVTAAQTETISVNATGKQTATLTQPTGYKADVVEYTLILTDDKLQTLTVTGDQKLVFASAATQLDLGLIDASANTGGVTIDASLADTTANQAVPMTIKGSLTAANTLTGTQNADTIVGGAKADVITGGAGADLMTGGGGRDKFVIEGTTTKVDTVTDFGLASVTVSKAENAAMSNFQSSTLGKGGADADVLDLTGTTLLVASPTTGLTATQLGDLKTADATSDVTKAMNISYAVNAKGLLTVSGADAGSIDTLTEWVALAGVLTGGSAGTITAFNFGGHAYIFDAEATNVLVQLTGVTVGASNGIVVSGTSTAAAVGDLFVV